MSRRNRNRVVSPVGLESLETRSLMSATALPPDETVVAGLIPGPHIEADAGVVNPLDKAGLIPYVTRLEAGSSDSAVTDPQEKAGLIPYVTRLGAGGSADDKPDDGPVDPADATGILPYIEQGSKDVGIGLLQPADVNADQSLAATVTFGGTLKDPSGTYSLTFNGQ